MLIRLAALALWTARAASTLSFRRGIPARSQIAQRWLRGGSFEDQRENSHTNRSI